MQDYEDDTAEHEHASDHSERNWMNTWVSTQ